MNLNVFFKKINENYSEIASVSDKKTKKSYLESIVTKTYELYFKNNEKYKNLLSLLCEIDYNHNYDYWTWIEYALFLMVYDNDVKGKDNGFYIDKINSAINSGSELEVFVKKNVISRISLDSFFNDHSNDGNIDASIENIMRLLKIRFFSQSTEEKIKVDKIIDSLKLNI